MGERSILVSYMAVVVGSYTLAFLQCRDGARRFFTDLAEFACLHQARFAVRCHASRMKGGLHPTTVRTACEADLQWMTACNGG